MNFVEIWNYYKFRSDCKGNSYHLQNILQTFNYLILCANHNEEDYGDEIHPFPIKLAMFIIPCYRYQTCICNKCFNFFKNLKIQNQLESGFCKLYFVS
jgi:hypothetical protein